MVNGFPCFAESPFFSEGSDGTAGGSFNHRLGLVLKPLGVRLPSGNLLPGRKRSLLVADFMSDPLPNLPVRYPSRFLFPLLDGFLDLTGARALRFEILLRVALDLNGVVRAPLDFEAARQQVMAHLGVVDRAHSFLNPKQLRSLERAPLPGRVLREIHQNVVAVQLRRGVAVHRPGRCVLEGDPESLPCRLCWSPRAGSRLDELTAPVDSYAFSAQVRFPQRVVLSDQCCHAHAFRSVDRHVPARPVSEFVTGLRLNGVLVTDELLARAGVNSIFK